MVSAPSCHDVGGIEVVVRLTSSMEHVQGTGAIECIIGDRNGPPLCYKTIEVARFKSCRDRLSKGDVQGVNGDPSAVHTGTVVFGCKVEFGKRCTTSDHTVFRSENHQRSDCVYADDGLRLNGGVFAVVHSGKDAEQRVRSKASTGSNGVLPCDFEWAEVVFDGSGPNRCVVGLWPLIFARQRGVWWEVREGRRNRIDRVDQLDISDGIAAHVRELKRQFHNELAEAFTFCNGGVRGAATPWSFRIGVAVVFDNGLYDRVIFPLVTQNGRVRWQERPSRCHRVNDRNGHGVGSGVPAEVCRSVDPIEGEVEWVEARSNGIGKHPSDAVRWRAVVLEVGDKSLVIIPGIADDGRVFKFKRGAGNVDQLYGLNGV